MTEYNETLRFENGVLIVCLDSVLSGNDDVSESYKRHGRFGFSYQPYGKELAEKFDISTFLASNLKVAESLKGVSIIVTLKDVGISTSFLRGLLKPVLELSPFENWGSKFKVVVNGRYEKTSDLSAIAFAQGESSTGIEYIEVLAELKKQAPSHYQMVP